MKASELPTCEAEHCDKLAFVQDLGCFTDPPGTEHWWCEDHAMTALSLPDTRLSDTDAVPGRTAKPGASNPNCPAGVFFGEGDEMSEDDELIEVVMTKGAARKFYWALIRGSSVVSENDPGTYEWLSWGHGRVVNAFPEVIESAGSVGAIAREGSGP